VLGWPVEATLRRGLELGELDGMPPWRAEHATNGLVNHEAYYVETASWILSENAGVVLGLPGARRTLVVGEDDFDNSVTVGEPIYYTELDESGVIEAVPMRNPSAE
jgi:hypothetical protein